MPIVVGILCLCIVIGMGVVFVYLCRIILRLRRPLAWANRDQEELAKADLLGALLEWIFSLAKIDLRKTRIFKLPTLRSEIKEREELLAFPLEPLILNAFEPSTVKHFEAKPLTAKPPDYNDEAFYQATHYHTVGGPVLYARSTDPLNQSNRNMGGASPVALVPPWEGIEEIELESVPTSPSGATPTAPRPKFEELVSYDEDESACRSTDELEGRPSGSPLFARGPKTSSASGGGQKLSSASGGGQKLSSSSGGGQKSSRGGGLALGEGVEESEERPTVTRDGWTKVKEGEEGKAVKADDENDISIGQEVTKELLSDGFLLVQPVTHMMANSSSISDGRKARLLGEEGNQRLGGLFADYRCDNDLTLSFFSALVLSSAIIACLFGIQARAKNLQCPYTLTPDP